MPAPESAGSILVAIGVLLAIVERTPSAWLSALLAFCDFSLVLFEHMKEENVMKKVLVMVGNGVFGVT